MSCGLRQFALSASSYQLCSGPRALEQPGRSQNFFRLLLAITLIVGQYLPFWEKHQGQRLLGGGYLYCPETPGSLVPSASLRVTMHRSETTRNNADRHVPSW